MVKLLNIKMNNNAKLHLTEIVLIALIGIITIITQPPLPLLAIPFVALGGEEFDINNVQTLCIKCNKIKTRQDMKDIAKARKEERINDHLIQGKLQTSKIIKVKVTRESQEEMNEIRKKAGLEEEPVVPEYELEALFK